MNVPLSTSELINKKSQKELARELVSEIGRLSKLAAEKRGGQPLRFMEVCGTHTVSIFRGGIRQLLPDTVELVSGPGCPVCVTHDDYMDKAIAYSQRDDVIITTFGDMLKVPGSRSSLSQEKAKGADIRIVYSPMDSLQIAKDNPEKKVIFLAVGFETTIPTAAATVLAAKQQGLSNLYMLSAHKLVPPVMKVLLDDVNTRVDGFILPGHVCVVTGTEVFEFLARDYHKPGVVTGFEPLEILRSLYRLSLQAANGEAKIENEYSSVVRREGNPQAIKIQEQVYQVAEASWRGMGNIPLSGMKMRPEFSQYDIEWVLPLEMPEKQQKKTACRCGEVLQGKIKPMECPLFGKACVPEHAIGPCMVSVEGTCAAWYKYGRSAFKFGK